MDSEAEVSVEVEIVLAFRDRHYSQRHVLPRGACIADLVRLSGILDCAPELDRQTLGWAIHGRAADPHTRLRSGDRVEILRPLRVDPKQARRRRARLKAQS